MNAEEKSLLIKDINEALGLSIEEEIESYRGNFLGFWERYIIPAIKRIESTEEKPYVYIKEDYYKEWDEIEEKNKKNNIVSHRGSSKTDFFTIGKTIYYAILKLRRQQALGSATGIQTEDLGNRVKLVLLNISEFRHLLPFGAKKESSLKSWNNKMIALRNNSTIIFRSIDAEWRNLHLDRIVLDDVITETCKLSDKKTEEKVLGAIHGCTTAKNANFTFVNTPRRHTDIINKLKEKKHWSSYSYPAEDGTMKDILSKRKNPKILEEIKSDIGINIYNREYLLRPTAEGTSKISRADIEESKKMGLGFDLNYKREPWMKRVISGHDYAFSKGKNANFSGFISVAEVEGGKFLILDYWKERGIEKSVQLAKMHGLNESYAYDAMAVELNTIQAIVTDVSSINLPLKFYWTGSADSKPGSEKKEYKSISKANAIERLATDFEPANRRIIMPYASEEARKKMDELGEELLSWANDENGKIIEIGIHPDVGIGLMLACEELRQKKKKIRVMGKPIF